MKEIFIFALLKNPKFQIIKNFILLQVDDCVRLVKISNKIVFNFSGLNDYPLHYKFSWIYRGACDSNNLVRYSPDYYLIKNEYLIKYQMQTFLEGKDCYIENEI